MGSYLHVLKPNKTNLNVFTILAKGDNSYGNIYYLNKKLHLIKIFFENFQCFGIDCYGQLLSWGLNDYFQLANNKNNIYLYQKPIPINNNNNKNIHNFINSFNYIAKNNNTIFDEKNNNNFNYGINNIYFPINPININKISCGDGFSVFLTKFGTVFTVGRNDKGQLGYELTNEESKIISGIKCNNIPKKIDKIDKLFIIDIICGRDFVYCKEKQNGNYYSWGNNTNYQLGRDNTIKYSFNPELVDFGINNNNNNKIKFQIEKLCCGWMHVTFLTQNNELYIYGNPFIDYDNKYKDILFPLKININSKKYKIIDISSGFHHISIVINFKQDETKFSLMTFGANDFYQLGYDTNTLYTIEPKIVNFPINELNTKVIEGICGAFHTIVRFEGDIIYGFGQNDNKQIGNYKEDVIKYPMRWNYYLDDNNISEVCEGDTENDMTKMLDKIICANGSTMLLYKPKKYYEEEIEKNKNKNKYIEVDVASNKINQI